MGITLSSGTILTGCNLVETDSANVNTTSNYDNVLTYVSGKVIDAATQMPIANAIVKIKVDGRWLQTTSNNSDNHTKGDFRFEGLPKQSFTYDMIIEAPSGTSYAPAYFTSDATTLEVGNSESDSPEISLTNISILHGTSGRGDMGLLKLIPAVSTSVTILDTDGVAIEGLQLHWDILEDIEAEAEEPDPVAEEEPDTECQEEDEEEEEPDTECQDEEEEEEEEEDTSGFAVNSGQIDIQATSTEAGVYSFNIPKGQTISVDLAEAVDAAGNRYQLLSGEDFAAINANLTQLTAGENEIIVLRKKSSRDVTINFYMFNEQGEAINDLGKGLQVTDTIDDSNYALQEVIPGTAAVPATDDSEAIEATPETPTNKYSFVAQKKRAYTWVLPAIDADADGLADYATKILAGNVQEEPDSGRSDAPAPIDDHGQDEGTEGIELDINEGAYLTETKDAEGNISYSVSYNVILKDAEENEAISHEVLSKRFIANSIGELKIAFNRPVRLLGDKPVWATHTDFETAMFEDRVRVQDYADVLNDNGDDTGEVSLENLRYSYSNGSEDVSVAVPGIDADRTVNNIWSTNFSEVITDIAVNGELSNNGTVLTVVVTDPSVLSNLDQYTIHYAVEGLSDTSILHETETVTVNSGTTYALADFVVDNADGQINEGRTAFDRSVLDIVSINQPLRINLPNYNGLVDARYAEAVPASSYESNDGTKVSLNNALNLVLPTNATGSIKVLGYVETHPNETSEADTTTETVFLGSEIVELNDPKEYNDSLLESFYSYTLPRNEYVTNVPEVAENESGMDMEFGFNLTEGWYYKVEIPGIAPEEVDGYISEVTLDFDLEYGSDQHIKGIKTFTVR